MRDEFTKNEIKEINKALVRSEEDIKNGRVLDEKQFWERIDNFIEKNYKIQKKY